MLPNLVASQALGMKVPCAFGPKSIYVGALG